MKRYFLISTVLLTAWQTSQAFCGFYVAKAGAELFNNKSEVILVRDGKHTVITMSNDFKGSVKDFAMVVPVPVVLQKDQIKVVNRTIFQTLDAYSAPRLVEYYDNNPCYAYDMYEDRMSMAESVQEVSVKATTKDEKKYKVTIEAQYTIGEYDILILSAKESSGLKQWLLDNQYQIPEKAERVLEPYIKSNLKFFVVKVNLEKAKQTGFDYLRPIQISFNAEKFMLPIRLGMANASGDQDLIVYAFTKTGRVESVNYRTTLVPTARNIPVFVKEKFSQFYFDLFDKAYANEGKSSVFLEYAWNVTPSWGGMKCDPCIGPPPLFADLSDAGVSWANAPGQTTFFTRLHVRYTEDKFPEDLFFQVTPNQEQYQARYIITHPASGDLNCDEGKIYKENLEHRRKRELMELAALTNWNTFKYTKYVNEGSGWVDERKNEVVPGSPEDDGYNTPGIPKPIFLLGFVLSLLLLVMAQRSARSESHRMKKFSA